MPPTSTPARPVGTLCAPPRSWVRQTGLRRKVFPGLNDREPWGVVVVSYRPTPLFGGPPRGPSVHRDANDTEEGGGVGGEGGTPVCESSPRTASGSVVQKTFEGFTTLRVPTVPVRLCRGPNPVRGESRRRAEGPPDTGASGVTPSGLVQTRRPGSGGRPRTDVTHTYPSRTSPLPAGSRSSQGPSDHRSTRHSSTATSFSVTHDRGRADYSSRVGSDDGTDGRVGG